MISIFLIFLFFFLNYFPFFNANKNTRETYKYDYCNTSPLEFALKHQIGLFNSNIGKKIEIKTVSIVTVIRHGDRTTLFPHILLNNTYRNTNDTNFYFNYDAASKRTILKNYQIIYETNDPKNNEIDVSF